MSDNEKDPEEESPFAVEFGEVELGKTYPLYGIITKILSEDPCIVVVNYNMKLYLSVNQPEQLEILKERSFDDPGIFITEITKVDFDDRVYPFEGTVSTVVFGRKRHTTIDA